MEYILIIILTVTAVLHTPVASIAAEPEVKSDAYVQHSRYFTSTELMAHLAYVEPIIMEYLLSVYTSIHQTTRVLHQYIKDWQSQMPSSFSNIPIPTDEESRELLKKSVHHPINSLHLLKRRSIMFQHINNSLTSSVKTIQDAMGVLNHIAMPLEGDVTGSAVSLLRLVEAYKLDIKKLARGVLEGVFINLISKDEPAVAPKLSETDVEVISNIAQHFGFTQQAADWINAFKEEDAVKDGANSTRCSTKGAGLACSAHEKYDKRNETVFDFPKMRSNEEELEITKLLCQGRRLRSAEFESQLYCEWNSLNSPYYLLMPLKIEVLSLMPRVVVFRHFLAPSLSQYFINESKPYLEVSETTRNGIIEGEVTVSDTRLSMSTTLGRPEHDMIQDGFSKLEDEHVDDNEIVTKLNIQIEQATKLLVNSPRAAEEYHVTNYGVGGHYGPHHDNIISSKGTGDRIATFLIYLTDVGAGGGTVFTRLGIHVLPEAGSALFWYNVNSSGTFNQFMRHAACPVLYGNKWILTKWALYNEQFRTTPCALNRYAKL